MCIIGITSKNNPYISKCKIKKFQIKILCMFVLLLSANNNFSC